MVFTLRVAEQFGAKNWRGRDPFSSVLFIGANDYAKFDTGLVRGDHGLCWSIRFGRSEQRLAADD